jgi:hypothetical protein
MGKGWKIFAISFAMRHLKRLKTITGKKNINALFFAIITTKP